MKRQSRERHEQIHLRPHNFSSAPVNFEMLKTRQKHCLCPTLTNTLGQGDIQPCNILVLLKFIFVYTCTFYISFQPERH